MGTKAGKGSISPQSTATGEFRLRVHLHVWALTHVHTHTCVTGHRAEGRHRPPMVLLRRLSSQLGGERGPAGPGGSVPRRHRAAVLHPRLVLQGGPPGQAELRSQVPPPATGLGCGDAAGPSPSKQHSGRVTPGAPPGPSQRRARGHTRVTGAKSQEGQPVGQDQGGPGDPWPAPSWGADAQRWGTLLRPACVHPTWQVGAGPGERGQTTRVCVA